MSLENGIYLLELTPHAAGTHRVGFVRDGEISDILLPEGCLMWPARLDRLTIVSSTRLADLPETKIDEPTKIGSVVKANAFGRKNITFIRFNTDPNERYHWISERGALFSWDQMENVRPSPGMGS